MVYGRICSATSTIFSIHKGGEGYWLFFTLAELYGTPNCQLLILSTALVRLHLKPVNWYCINITNRNIIDS
jgi:hypothetical protein